MLAQPKDLLRILRLVVPPQYSRAPAYQRLNAVTRTWHIVVYGPC